MPTNETSPAEAVCFQCHRPAAADKDLCRFCILEAEASEAFWAAVARHFPETKHGDLSPERTIRFSQAAVAAIEEWIGNNVPVICKTCSSEIVATVNDSAFGDGECGGCEYERYRRACNVYPDLLKLAGDYREACSTRIDLLKGLLADEHEFSGDATDLRDQIAHWKAARKNCDTVIAKAHGKPM